MPSFPPGPDGTPIILIDITDKPEVQEGWDYNTKTGEFAESILLDLPPVQESLKDQIQGLQQAIAELTILLAGGEA